MSDQYGNQYVTVGDPIPVATGGFGWLWGLLIFIIVVIAVIFLILWLVERSRKNELILTNVVFSTPNATTIRGTWVSSNSNDQIIMYVFRTGTPINFNSDGTPAVPSDVVSQSAPVTGSGTAVATVPVGNVSYTAVLVVTNPNFSGYDASNVSGALTPGPSPANTGVFHIQASGQSGEITYSIPPSGSQIAPSVGYNFSRDRTNDSNLFFNDVNGLLCTVPLLQSGAVNFNPTTTLCSDLGTNTFILYDTGTSNGASGTNGTSRLGIRRITPADSTNTNNNNARWNYNPTTNKWCTLTGTTSVAINRCMELPVTSATQTVPINMGPTGTSWTNVSFSLS